MNLFNRTVIKKIGYALPLLLVSGISGANLGGGGANVGNGGDAVVCFNADHSIRSVQLLDLYEGAKNGFTLSEHYANLSRADYLTNVFRDLSQLDNVLVKSIKTKAILMHAEIAALELDPQSSTELVSFTEDHLVDVNDSRHLTFPQGCEVQQMVIRLDETQRKFSDAKNFIIQKNLWDRLTPSQQGATLMHEVIYEVFAKIGDKDSIRARYLNAAINSKPSIKKYIEIINKLEITATREFAVFLMQQGITYFELPKLTSGFNPLLEWIIFLTQERKIPFVELPQYTQGIPHFVLGKALEDMHGSRIKKHCVLVAQYSQIVWRRKHFELVGLARSGSGYRRHTRLLKSKIFIFRAGLSETPSKTDIQNYSDALAEFLPQVYSMLDSPACKIE